VEKCRSCQFFDRNNAAAKESKATQWGQCRRAAPVLSPLNQKPHMIEGVWPHVRDDDWCGEYKGLAKRLDAQLSELMSDPTMAGLGSDASIKPLFIPINTPRDPGEQQRRLIRRIW